MTYEDAAKYLLERDLITRSAVVGGDLTIINTSRRNSNLKVVNGAGPHYFLKQQTRPKPEGAREFASIGYEAQIYELLGASQGNRRVSRFLPRYLGFDQAEQLLVLEGLVGWSDLRMRHIRRSRPSTSIAAQLGTALADLHAMGKHEALRIEARLRVPDDPPWVFSLPEPDQWVYVNSSASNMELLRVIQESSELCQSLKALRQDWRNTALIHGDLKWDNCLAPVRARAAPTRGIKIVDWELARPGDPCWDVGAVFSAYLDSWLSGIPVFGERPPDEFMEHARLPLARIQPAVRCFWRAYCRRLEVPTADVSQWLAKATRFAGVRLVQTAFEEQQIESTMATRSVLLLQLASNLLTRPMEAAVHLLGIALRGPLPYEHR